jgi:hypothetical protein
VFISAIANPLRAFAIAAQWGHRINDSGPERISLGPPDFSTKGHPRGTPQHVEILMAKRPVHYCLPRHFASPHMVIVNDAYFWEPEDADVVGKSVNFLFFDFRPEDSIRAYLLTSSTSSGYRRSLLFLTDQY